MRAVGRVLQRGPVDAERGQIGRGGPVDREVGEQSAEGRGELEAVGGAEPDDDLRERDYGEYEGRTTKDIRVERPGWDVWRDDIPGGETLEQLAARADRAIERALAADGDALIFAHSHLLRELAGRWIGLDPDGGGKLVLATASLSTLGFERERRVLRAWNA